MLMWKAPNRQSNQITQSYNDGLVTIYSVTDKAKPGYKPVESLAPKIMLRYEEQRLGINRLYMSRQNQAEVTRVLRVPKSEKINTQDVAVTEDGKQYRIDVVQSVHDIFPPSIDISLVSVKQKFEGDII